MTTLNLDIQFDPRGAFQRMPTAEKLRPLVHRMVESIAIDGQRLMRKEAPRFRNQIQRGITYQMQGDFEAVVGVRGPAVAYAYVTEYGRIPGGRMPPVAAVTPWALKYHLDPFLVARSIGRKGGTGRSAAKNRNWRMRAAGLLTPQIRKAVSALEARIRA